MSHGPEREKTMTNQKRWNVLTGFFGALLTLGLVIWVAGCAAPQVPSSGFLSDYERLKPDSTEMGISWWESPGVQWKKYKKVMIDPVVVKIDPSKSEREMTKEEMEALAKKLRQTVVEVMRKRSPVVKAPGPDVLHIRAALTHLKPVSPAANIIASAILMWPIDFGEAAVETQFIDSSSGVILGEVVIGSRGSMMEITKVWTRWAQVEATFKQWAERLQSALDEAQKGP